MTVVVGLVDSGRVYLAGDRAISDDKGSVQLLAHPKIAKLKGYAIGFAGCMGVDAAIRRARFPALTDTGDVHSWLESEVLSQLQVVDVDLESSDGAEIIVAASGRLFISTGNNSLIEYSEVCAGIGSGASSAIAVLAALREKTKLKPRSLVANAVRYSSFARWDVGGGPDVVIV